MSTQTESLDALHTTGRSGTVDAAVLATVRAYGPICRDALCKATQISVSTMCGAIGRLKAQNLVVVAPETVWNNLTKRNVQAYVAHPDTTPTTTPQGEQDAEE